MSQAGTQRSQQRIEVVGDYAVALIVEPEDMREEAETLQATLLNLSISGAKLVVPKLLRQNRSVRVHLIVDKLGVSFYLAAQIRWGTVDERGRYLVGCSFSPNIPEGILRHIAGEQRLERRERDRRPALRKVELVRPGGRFWNREYAELRNYATGGFCLELNREVELGDHLKVRLNKKLPEVGVIVRWEMQRDKQTLVGCEFVDPTCFADVAAELEGTVAKG